MRVWNRFILSGFSVLSLAACAVTPASMTIVDQQLVVDGTTFTTARVSETGHGTAFVNIQAATDKALLGLSHRWVANDVYEYRFLLETADADGDFGVLEPFLLTVSNKNSYPAAAAFTGLEAGKHYKLTLQAWGNDGGTAATTQLNTATSSVAYINLTAANNLETHHTVNMQAVLNPQTYSADAAVTIDPPATSAPEAVGLTFINDDSDFVSPDSYATDAVGDGHFRFVIDLPPSTSLKRIKVTNSATGAWDSMHEIDDLVGVFQNGTPVQAAVATPLGTFSGRVAFDLYVPAVSGSYPVGRTYTATASDVAGDPVASQSFVIVP